MTIDLLTKPLAELEAMTDEQLMEYFKPFFVVTRPADTRKVTHPKQSGKISGETIRKQEAARKGFVSSKLQKLMALYDEKEGEI